jgi:hypothetical protein
MNIIIDIDIRRFSLNGIEYFKNYISNVAGTQLKIINAYDSNNILLDWTNYTQISVNGVVYGSIALLQSNLIEVCFNRSLTGGTTITNLNQIPTRNYIDLQNKPTNLSDFTNDTNFITASQIPTDSNSIVEVVNANFNTNNNTPLPTNIGDDNQDTAHLICLNGEAYFNWNGTAWVFVSFIAKFGINEIPDASTTQRGLVNITNQSFLGTKTFQDIVARRLLILNNQLGIKLNIFNITETVSGNYTILGHAAKASLTDANKVVAAFDNWIPSFIKMYYDDGITFHTQTQIVNENDELNIAQTERMRINANGNIGIGTNNPQAKLDVVSSTSGFLMPRMTENQRLSIVSPGVGTQVYQTNNTEGIYTYKSTGWELPILPTNSVYYHDSTPVVHSGLTGQTLIKQIPILANSFKNGDLYYIRIGINSNQYTETRLFLNNTPIHQEMPQNGTNFSVLERHLYIYDNNIYCVVGTNSKELSNQGGVITPINIGITNNINVFSNKATSTTVNYLFFNIQKLN